MRDASKLTDNHRARLCVIYVRQSSYAQVERNRESTARQYDLVALASALGWAKDAVLVIDEDLGLSGSGTAVSFLRDESSAEYSACNYTRDELKEVSVIQ